MRYKYRVSKYDPQYRDASGSYQKEEWTFFAQLGTRVAGRVLALREYQRVEKKYLDTIREMLKEARVVGARVTRASSRGSSTTGDATRSTRSATRERARDSSNDGSGTADSRAWHAREIAWQFGRKTWHAHELACHARARVCHENATAHVVVSQVAAPKRKFRHVPPHVLWRESPRNW